MHSEFKNYPQRTGLFDAILSIIRNSVLCILPKRLFAKDVSSDTVLITGAGSGLGRALAIEFTKLGSSLVLWDINKETLAKTKELIENIKEDMIDRESEQIFLTYVVDVSDREQIIRTKNLMKNDLGKKFISILINNSGVFSTKTVLETEPSAIEKMFQINVLSHFWTIKSFMPEMIEHKRGHIVEIASIAGLISAPNIACYGATKHAVVGLESCLSSELNYQGLNEFIKTTSICPSFFGSNLFKGYKPITFLPLLTLEYVVEKTMTAIRCDETLVTIPCYLPVWIFRYFNREYLHYWLNWLGLGDMIRDIETNF